MSDQLKHVVHYAQVAVACMSIPFPMALIPFGWITAKVLASMANLQQMKILIKLDLNILLIKNAVTAVGKARKM